MGQASASQPSMRAQIYELMVRFTQIITLVKQVEKKLMDRQLSTFEFQPAELHSSVSQSVSLAVSAADD